MEAGIPLFNVVIMQPHGFGASLCFIDHARYARHQLRRLGAEVLLSKNHLREDAVNLVFGAHLGFRAEWAERHCCVLFNLEQLGEGGALLGPDYLALLKNSVVVDYDLGNPPAYASVPAEVPIVSFQHAPYLERANALPLERRPIDLLFFGAMNPKRERFIRRVQACGRQVTTFNYAFFTEERDQFVHQSKAVINCHYYDSSRFEQARAFHTLSCGTPFISERRETTHPPAAFEDAVSWIVDADLERFFTEEFGTPAWYERARGQLAAFRRTDPLAEWRQLFDLARTQYRGHLGRARAVPWRPETLNLGCGVDYQPGSLNIDKLAAVQPDLVLDFCEPLGLPLRARARRGVEVELAPGAFTRVQARQVLQQARDLPALMSNVLALLAPNGLFEIEVPVDGGGAAWADPAAVRAFNDQSWVAFCDHFWTQRWTTHRFEQAGLTWLDAATAPCEKPQAVHMRVTLRKIETSLRERSRVRIMDPDFGGLPDDLPDSLAAR
ncbi:MAG: hypothetical protein JO369_08330 [Paucibacter sp.]|nr:hypothetical protein [Roseateles sp.]